jgi:far upstream element-binding protein
MNSTSAEEALERAKAIAARLSGSSDVNVAAVATATATAPSTTTTTSTKRKRWGVAPRSNDSTGTSNTNTNTSTTAPAEVLPGLSDAAKKLKQGVVVEPMKRRIWVTTSAERPPSHFLSYLPDKFQEIVNEVSKASDDKDSVKDKDKDSSMPITILLKGRGSSRVPSLIGMPEEPMHILLSGPPLLVPQAEPLVDALLVAAEKAPVEQLEPLEPLPQGSESNTYSNSNADNHLALTTTNSYRPATVAQLIANNAANFPGSDNLLEEQVGVPNGIVGYLIGRGGETISTLQAKTGCKIQIQKEHELQPGQVMRVITLQAATPASIAECRGMIETMVAERIRAAGGTPSNAGGGGGGNNAGGPKDAKVGDAVAAGHALVQVQVPDADVGLIIGKSGSTIKSIQESTGASIQIPPSGNADDPSVRTVSITHPNEEGALAAKQKIEGLLNSKPSYAGGNSGGGGQQLTIHIMVSNE